MLIWFKSVAGKLSLARIINVYIYCVIKKSDKQDVDGYRLLHTVHAVESQDEWKGSLCPGDLCRDSRRVFRE